MRKLLFSAAVALSAVLLSYAGHAQVSNTGLKKITNKHFNTGLQVGFWEVSSAQQLTLDSIGKRPTSRVGFDNWNNYEDTLGNYDFSKSCNIYARAHNYGETVLGAINMCFSDSVTNKNTIPNQYKHDIADSVTQAAGLRFIKNYVAYVLNHIGNITLTIDYEVVSNYKLNAPNSDRDRWGKTRAQRAADWANWYVKAARAARDTAAAMGMSTRLRLMPIVNGNPLDPTNPIHNGPSANPWLATVVDSSDYLAFDTYQSDPSTPVSSAQTTFNIMQFWIDSFSRSKDVIVTENGYNVATSYIPGVNRTTRGNKTTGTEAQQDTFYRQIFDSLYLKCQPNGSFHGKMRSYNMWAICDNPAKSPHDVDGDYYFGIIGLDTSDKHTPKYRPALTTVRNGIARIDSSMVLRPYDQTNTVNNISLPASVTYNNGDDFDFLRYRAKFNDSVSTKYYLHVKTATAGNLMIQINSGKWLYYPNVTSQDIRLDTTHAFLYFNNTQQNVIDVYCTDTLFPFTQSVTQVVVNTTPTARTTTAAAIATATNNISVYPNPTHASITIAGLIPGKTFRTEIFNTMGQLVKTASTAEINIADLANGVYQVRVLQDGKANTLQFVKE